MVRVGPLSLIALHTPGHAPDHLAFWMPDDRVLFTGDLILGPAEVQLIRGESEPQRMDEQHIRIAGRGRRRCLRQQRQLRAPVSHDLLDRDGARGGGGGCLLDGGADGLDVLVGLGEQAGDALHVRDDRLRGRGRRLPLR